MIPPQCRCGGIEDTQHYCFQCRSPGAPQYTFEFLCNVSESFDKSPSVWQLKFTSTYLTPNVSSNKASLLGDKCTFNVPSSGWSVGVYSYPLLCPGPNNSSRLYYNVVIFNLLTIMVNLMYVCIYTIWCICVFYKMCLVSTKPVFGVTEKVRLKPVSSATKTSWKIDISLEASLDMILANKRITKALICLRSLRLCCSQPPPLSTKGFLALRPK